MSDVKKFTNSEFGTWKRCPRRWYLAYYRWLDKPEPDFGRPTSLGTRVHKALERLYNPSVPSDVDVLQEMKDDIEVDIEKFPAYEVEIRKDGELAIIMMEGYLQWLAETGHDQDLKVVQPESGVEVAFRNDELVQRAGYDEAHLLSKLDVRVQKESDTSRWALEHKTVQSLSEPLPLLQIDAQLLTEHLVEYLKLKEEGLEDQTADGVLYNMLRKVKRTARATPPFYGREEVRHNKHELNAHWHHIMEWSRQILEAEIRLNSGESHHDVCPPINDRTCSWQCQFFQVCSLMNDGSDYEAALNDLYTQVDPLERYSKEVGEEAEGGSQ